MGMHDQYSRALGYDLVYEQRCVRVAGDNCGFVSSKYRKFVIIGVHEEHFITLCVAFLPLSRSLPPHLPTHL
jgi:hypothetical protein